MNVTPVFLKYCKRGLIIALVSLITLLIVGNILEMNGLHFDTNIAVFFTVLVFILMHIIGMLIAPLMADFILERVVKGNVDAVNQFGLRGRSYNWLLKNRSKILNVYTTVFWSIAILGLIVTIPLMISDVLTTLHN